MQGALFLPEAPWRPLPATQWPSWAGADRVCIDTETRDPDLGSGAPSRDLGPGQYRDPRQNYVVGVSIGIEDGPRLYLPLRHEGGDNVECPEAALAYIREQARHFTGTVAGFHLAYDLEWLAVERITFPKAKWFRDAEVAEALLDELQLKYSMEAVCARRGIEGKDEGALREGAGAYGVHPKRDLWRLPARYVGAYAEADTDRPLRLLRKQEREVDEQDLWNVYNLESELLPALVRIRQRGVRVHQGRLAEIEHWTLEEEKKALDELHRLTGCRVAVGDVNRPEPFLPAMEFMNVKVPRTPKSQKPSIDKFLLAKIEHPAARCIERARKVNKLRTTFAASVWSHLCPDGRIHCILNQTRRSSGEGEDGEEDGEGGRYGRLSCTDPNLQQQPARDEFAQRWRSIYLPEEGQLWAACDYSQQEPRWTIHYADLLGLPRAHEAAERYRNDPKTDNHTMMGEMIYGRTPSSKERKEAKEIFLGLCYGMGGPKLCAKLGLPTRYMVSPPRGGAWQPAVPADSPEGQRLLAEGGRRFLAAGEEGQRLLDLFDSAVPFVRKLAWEAQRKAKAAGFIVTAGGRRCRFPKDLDGNWDWTHKALNRLIQGSSADQTKRAVVDLDRAGFWVMLQVHDEVALSVLTANDAEYGAEVMRNALPMRVPCRVDVEVGASWGESMAA